MNASYSTHSQEKTQSSVFRPSVCKEALVMDDELVLRQAFASDPRKGCELLFRRYYTNLCNHAIRFVYSKEVAEDIVAELFANFWYSRVFDEISTSYRAYLYRAVRNRAYNYLAWQFQRTDSMDAIEHMPVDTTLKPDEVLQYSELHQKIEYAIQQLPAQCQRAFLLKRIEGKKYTEIAEEMQIGTKAVEALVSRALTRLRAELKNDWFLGLSGLVILSIL
ncbi:RNA polymerase sigma-70 factor [Arsenicibacter rosenii]|nr:RNA polymerase sigma-70 factor [Arsenicibacter rosenii]